MRGWSIGQWALAIVCLGGFIAIVYIALRAMGIPLPSWVTEMGWVLLIVLAAAAVIGLIAKVWSSWGSGPPTP